MIITDTFIEIGSSHKVCQDYIIKDEPTNSIILSDGCSSSKHTDIGARILTHLALKRFRNITGYVDNVRFGLSVADQADSIAKDLDLPPEAIDATLILSFYAPDVNHIFVNFYGDGYVVTVDKNDKMKITYIEYEKQMPYYLSYEAVALFENKRKYQELNIKQSTHVLEGPEGFMGVITDIKDGTFRQCMSFAVQDLKCLLVASDGLGSFVHKERTLDPKEIIKLFLNYPVKNGEFLKRTMIHQLKVLAKEGITHYDDLSIGAYLIKD